MVTRLMKSNPAGGLSVVRLLVRALAWYSSSAICHKGTNVLADLTANTSAAVAVITDRLLADADSEVELIEAAVLRTVRASAKEKK